MLLSILIPSLENRVEFREKLMGQLLPQVKGLHRRVEILLDIDSGETSIGEKRNRLLDRAKGRYCAFIDDDDRIHPEYVNLVLSALASSPDCCSLNGEITFVGRPGRNTKPFTHSIRHGGSYFGNGIYYRTPNHLNAIRTDHCRAIRFPVGIARGEDTDFCNRMHAAGLLKVEADIPETIYFYDYVENKNY